MNSLFAALALAVQTTPPETALAPRPACPMPAAAHPSDHFDGARFFNPDGEQGSGGARHKSTLQFLELALGIGGPRGWPREVPVVPTKPDERVHGSALRVTWVGHATTLIQTEGLNILLDPVWSHRDSPVPFLGPRRVRAPGVRLEDLPPIDLVLVSHTHFDHLDTRALGVIARRDKPLVIAGLGVDGVLAQHGIAARVIDWGESVPVRPGIAVVGTRAHHWSARGRHDIDCTLWTGFRLTLPGGDVFYAGDSGAGDLRWPLEARGSAPVRLAILPIGPYQVANPPTGNHIDPDEAVAAFKLLGAHHALGVHWGTFELSDEPIDGPPTRVRAAMRREGLAEERFRTLEAGASWDVPLPARP